jgi:hypothetical protein
MKKLMMAFFPGTGSSAPKPVGADEDLNGTNVSVIAGTGALLNPVSGVIDDLCDLTNNIGLLLDTFYEPILDLFGVQL